MKKAKLLSALLLVGLLGGCFKDKELDTLKKQCSFKERQSCEKLVQIYQKDCDANNADSCLELGRLYQNSPKRDFTSAKAYYKKAQDLGLSKAKTYLSFLEYGFAPAISKNPLQYGLIDIEGNFITEEKYSDFDLLNNGFIKVATNDKYGILNQEGKEILEPQFEEIKDYSEGLIAVRKDDKWGFIDEWGDIVIDFTFKSAYDFHDRLAPAKKDELFGFINKKGEFVIQPQFDATSYFRIPYTLASKSGKWGIIDKNGNFIINPIYDNIEFFGDFFKVTLNEKISFIDASGKILIENIEEVSSYADSFIDFTDNIFSIKINGKWGLINQKLEFLLEAKFDNFYRMADKGLIKLESNNKFGIANAKFQVIAESEFDAVGKLDNGLISIKKNGKWGFIDENGKRVIPTIYEKVYSFYKDLARVKLNRKWGFIDKSGKMVIPAIYVEASNFHEGLAAVKLNNQWGFINKKGKMVIKPQFAEAQDFYGEIAGIYLNHDWGFINKKGEIIIEPQFSYLEYSTYANGLIKAKMRYDTKVVFFNKKGELIEIPSVFYAEEDNGYIKVSVINKKSPFDKEGLIDTKGNFILEPFYDEISILGDIALLKIYENDDRYSAKYGFLNLENNVFIKPEYDYLVLEDFIEELGFIRFQKGSKIGLMDKNGKILIEPKFFDLGRFLKLTD
ncbi:WG repeat-containing protein [Helicobacter burdigaliensis]|uniref:WG repeat-containing protein n=1 Tax=Helicobacter burdigaliensis TaxID=2315334 RepID=UPI000EF75821|nr:WG repeat-containing protein [Helicobacter burdigaliensis]